MRFKKIFCAGGIVIIFTAMSLFLVNGIALGQCVPGSKGSMYGGHEGYWLSSETNKAPFSLWAPSVQANHPNHRYANVWLHDIPWCIWEDYTGEYNVLFCDGVYQCAPDPCYYMGTTFPWTCKRYCYTEFDQDPGTSRDYDCDATFDSQDPNPGSQIRIFWQIWAILTPTVVTPTIGVVKIK
jgi:hypothetical protein